MYLIYLIHKENLIVTIKRCSFMKGLCARLLGRHCAWARNSSAYKLPQNPTLLILFSF